jgi:putative transposase
MIRAHKIQLKANNKQATYFAKSAGVARKAYNWALEEWQKQYQAGSKPNEAALRRLLNSIKKDAFPYMLEVTKNAPQMAIMQLGQAFNNFFAKRARYPRFRCKGKDDRFTLTNDQFKVDGTKIHIPRLGWVKMHESLRFSGKIVSATISKKASRWFVSITVEVMPCTIPTVNDSQIVVGIDLGINHFAVLSNGDSIKGPKPYQRLMHRLKRLAKRFSQKVKFSNNYQKAKLKLAKLHHRITNIRRNYLHELTHRLISLFKVIGIEDLHVKGMLRNHCLARSIADMGFYEFKRQLLYKAQANDVHIVIADRWFPSSKTCHHCQYYHKSLQLSERKWQCPNCESCLDRDLNASINLEEMAASSAVTACGASSGGACTFVRASQVVLKQESNIKAHY